MGSTTWSDGHTHDWVRDENGNITILDAEGHSHGLTALIKAADGVTNEILAESMLASIDQNESPASVTKAATGPMDNIMTDEEKAEFTKAADNKLNVEKARADRAEQIVKLSPDQRAHYEALSADNQGTFLKAENKDAILKNAEAADPVEHVNLDGIEIRKSEGAAFIKLAKSHDELRKQVATSNAIAKRATFAKRATDELGHLTGDESAKADLLEAVDSLSIEKREAVTAILKSKDAGMAKAFETVGTSDDGTGEGLDNEAKFQKLADNILTKSKSSTNPLTPEQAYVEALDTPEGIELQTQMRS